jgi:uncharacterized low-complexity protein
MESTKKTILTGTMIATAILGGASMKANTSNLFDFTSLGSGSEVRSVLLNSAPSAVKIMDLNCGEKKDAKTADTKKAGDSKAKDGKCGEGKCGDKKTADTKKATDSKAKDGKCGEGKCGDKKAKPATQPK